MSLSFDPALTGAADHLPALSWQRLICLPLAGLAALAITTVPGMTLVTSFGRTESNLGERVLQGFVVTVATMTIVSALFVLLLGTPATAPLLLGTGAICVLIGSLAGIKRFAMARPGVVERRDLVVALCLMTSAIVLFGSKLTLEAFNSDGLQMLITAERMRNAATPFWPAGSDYLNVYPDFRTIASHLPITLYVTLLGPLEFSTRLLFPVTLVLFFLIAAAFIGAANSRIAFGLRERLLIAATLIVFTMAHAYSATYEVYADIALPLSREFLFCTMTIACLHFSERGQTNWAIAFAAIASISIPTGAAIIMLCMGLYAALDRRPQILRRAVFVSVSCILVILVSVSMPVVFAALDWPEPWNEFSQAAIRGRLRFLSVDDIERLAYLLVPIGIVPGIMALAFIRRADPMAMVMTLIGFAYFAFFYVQAFQALLHHFMPAAILLFVAFWRSRTLDSPLEPALRLAVAAGVSVSFWLSWPATFKPEDRPRILARSIVVDQGPTNSYSRETLLDTANAINRVFPTAEFIDRHKTGRIAQTGEVLAFYARRTPKDTANVTLRLCAIINCANPELERIGTVGILVAAPDKARDIVAALPSVIRHAPLLGVRPEKVFRTEDAVDGQSGRLIDLRALLRKIAP